MADGMIELSMRIEFYEVDGPFSQRKPEDYAGSMLKDGIKALAVPRVGEYIEGLEVNSPIVVAVQHGVEGFGTEAEEGGAPSPPQITVVIDAKWPGGVDYVEAFEAHGWRWDPGSDRR